MTADQKPTFSIDKAFSQAFSIFKQRFVSIYLVLGLMIVIGVVIGVVGQGFSFFLRLIIIGPVSLTTKNRDTITIAFIVGGLIVTVLSIFLNQLMYSIMYATTYKPLSKLGRNEDISSDDFSSGLSLNNLKNIILAQLLFFGIILTAIFVVTIPLTIYLGLRYSLVLFLIPDKNMTLREAMEESSRITKGNILPLFGFCIVNGLLVAAGILACCVGVLFTAPLGMLSLSVVYNQLIGSAPVTENPVPVPTPSS
ncbi:MAG: hypothetical protein WCP97_02885 [bacterium]